MEKIEFQILKAKDQGHLNLIADWYFTEWKIPVDKTLKRLETITNDSLLFQVLMTLDNIPVATGGIYNHVGLIDKVPRFSIYKNWLALIYTVPNQRQKGYGAAICSFIQEHSISLGLDTLYLFTDTAEQLYKRLGWTEVERVSMGERHVVVMKLETASIKTPANSRLMQ